MNETPFSPEIRPYAKPVEVGDTNQIYYDPNHPEAVIRVPIDTEAKFMEADPKLIGVADKIYRRLGDMGHDLDIDVAAHQFIIAKETSDGPAKPMLIAQRIDGNPLFPIDKENPKTLEALSRIVQLGLKYLQWIESSRPKSVVTDIFRPEQYIVRPGKARDKLTLIDIEPRLKDRDRGIKFVDLELGLLAGSLRDTIHNDTFFRYMHHAFQVLKQNRNYIQMASLVNIIVNAPKTYQKMSDDFLAGKEIGIPLQELSNRTHNAPLVVSRELLKKFGIEKI